MARLGEVLLNSVALLMKVWGVLFGWLYSMISNPAQVRKNYVRVRSKPSKKIMEGDTTVTYQPNDLGNPKFIS